MEEFRNHFFKTNVRLSNKDIIEVAKTDHLLWKWKVYNMLLGLETPDLEQVSSHETCRLGKWYYGNISAQFKDLPAFKQLEEPHQAVHQYAKQAVQYYIEGDVTGAEKAFEHLHKASDTVISLLSKL